LKTRDGWWSGLFDSVTFGGFVGLTSVLSIVFHDEYGLTAVQAGNFATVRAVAGSLIRPVGGSLPHRFGGIRLLLRLDVGVAIVMGARPAWWARPAGWADSWSPARSAVSRG